MGSAAAADTDVPDAQVARRSGEVGHLEAVAEERFERERKPARPVGVLQRLEVRLRRRRPVRNRLRRDMTADRSADPVEASNTRPVITRGSPRRCFGTSDDGAAGASGADVAGFSIAGLATAGVSGAGESWPAESQDSAAAR